MFASCTDIALIYNITIAFLFRFLPFIVHLILSSFNHICWNHRVETYINEKPERWKLKLFVFHNKFYWTLLERKWKNNSECKDNILLQTCFPSWVSVLNLTMTARTLFGGSKCFNAVWVCVEKTFLGNVEDRVLCISIISSSSWWPMNIYFIIL